MFTEKEQAYLKDQRLARIATVSKTQQPDVAPVGFEFDGTHFFVGGITLTKTLKYKNVKDGNTSVALVIDNLEIVKTAWKPQGIKIHGTAGIVERKGKLGTGLYLRITVDKYWSWGIEQPAFVDGKPVIKRVG